MRVHADLETRMHLLEPPDQRRIGDRVFLAVGLDLIRLGDVHLMRKHPPIRRRHRAEEQVLFEHVPEQLLIAVGHQMAVHAVVDHGIARPCRRIAHHRFGQRAVFIRTRELIEQMQRRAWNVRVAGGAGSGLAGCSFERPETGQQQPAARLDALAVAGLLKVAEHWPFPSVRVAVAEIPDGRVALRLVETEHGRLNVVGHQVHFAADIARRHIRLGERVPHRMPDDPAPPVARLDRQAAFQHAKPAKAFVDSGDDRRLGQPAGLIHDAIRFGDAQTELAVLTDELDGSAVCSALV